MNLSLPELAVWKARSFWAQLLLIASVLLNSAGIDIMGMFSAMGMGDNPEEVIDQGVSLWQTLAPVVFGFWAWWERRAPNFRLAWTLGGRGAALALVVGLSLMAIPPAGAARAETLPPPVASGPICDARSHIVAYLERELGETQQAVGLLPDGLMELWASEATRGWSLLRTGPEGVTCLVAAGFAFEPGMLIRKAGRDG